MARAACSEARQIREVVQSFKRASSAEAETTLQDEDEGGDDEDIQVAYMLDPHRQIQGSQFGRYCLNLSAPLMKNEIEKN